MWVEINLKWIPQDWLSNEMKNNFIKGFAMNTWNMEIPILQNQIFCIYNTDVSWKLWRFEHERLRKSCPFTHQFGGQLMLRTLMRCAPFCICSLQSFAITTIVMDSQERRNVWQSLQTNWSFSEHTFPLCMLLGKHVTSSLIGILLYDFSAKVEEKSRNLVSWEWGQQLLQMQNAQKRVNGNCQLNTLYHRKLSPVLLVASYMNLLPLSHSTICKKHDSSTQKC